MMSDRPTRLEDAIAAYEEATMRVAELSEQKDAGSGERTARLANIAQWQRVVDRSRATIEEITGKPYPPPDENQGADQGEDVDETT
jgi:hypothetical protein